MATDTSRVKAEWFETGLEQWLYRDGNYLTVVTNGLVNTASAQLLKPTFFSFSVYTLSVPNNRVNSYSASRCGESLERAAIHHLFVRPGRCEARLEGAEGVLSRPLPSGEGRLIQRIGYSFLRAPLHG